MTQRKRIKVSFDGVRRVGRSGRLRLDGACGADIFVVGGKPDDPFWSIVKRGAEDAGKVVEAQGGTVTWLGPQNYDNLGVDAAELIRQAIDQGADAIVGPDWVPEAMDPAFKAVVDAGIPLIVYNAGGLEAADRLGAMNYVGSDDYKAGVAAGEYFADNGLKNLVCVNSLPGAANIEAHCKGMTDGVTSKGGAGETLPLPATSFGNSTAVAQAVKAYLLQHPDVVGVYTIGNVDANSSISAIMQSGKAGQGAGRRREHGRDHSGQYPERRADVHHRPAGLPAGLPRGGDPERPRQLRPDRPDPRDPHRPG